MTGLARRTAMLPLLSGNAQHSSGVVPGVKATLGALGSVEASKLLLNTLEAYVAKRAYTALL